MPQDILQIVCPPVFRFNSELVVIFFSGMKTFECLHVKQREKDEEDVEEIEEKGAI